MNPITFKIEKKIDQKLGRAGLLTTPHGVIETPSFVVVGTKATVKGITPAQLKEMGVQVVLSNTYHLYLQPGEEVMKKAGGLHTFMGWDGPTMTDSGGFQAFSLGAAFGKGIGKVTSTLKNDIVNAMHETQPIGEGDERPLAKITEDGVQFKSVLDGSDHMFTPERSMEIQHAIGADMMFAFDECTSPLASREYQQQALERTHRWAERCIEYHKKSGFAEKQALFGIVQGGRFEDLRKESAKVIGAMDFDGFGIGGSFNKEDMDTAVGWVNAELPEGKPRHLLGIGDPLDLLNAVENGCDLFDCVAPTRIGRNGTLYTSHGTVHIANAKYVNDFTPLEKDCGCYTCQNFTRAYLSHLFRAREMGGSILASIHNIYFIVHLVKKMRAAILEGRFQEFKAEFVRLYKK